MNLDVHLLLYTLITTLFTAGCTTLGAACVYFFRNIKKGLTSFLMCFASGVMLAGAFFSLLIPAIDFCREKGMNVGLLLGVGCLLGFLFMFICERIIAKTEATNTFSPKMLALSITLHNIPEGMCIGVAFATAILSPNLLASALALAIGIGVQNIPEGASISLPLYLSHGNKKRAFLSGMFSGIVEPISAVLAFIFASFLMPVLPAILSFAASCMIYVSVVELVPEAQRNSVPMASIGLIVGFMFMLLLDVLL